MPCWLLVLRCADLLGMFPHVVQHALVLVLLHLVVALSGLLLLCCSKAEMYALPSPQAMLLEMCLLPCWLLVLRCADMLGMFPHVVQHALVLVLLHLVVALSGLLLLCCSKAEMYALPSPQAMLLEMCLLPCWLLVLRCADLLGMFPHVVQPALVLVLLHLVVALSGWLLLCCLEVEMYALPSPQPVLVGDVSSGLLASGSVPC